MLTLGLCFILYFIKLSLEMVLSKGNTDISHNYDASLCFTSVARWASIYQKRRDESLLLLKYDSRKLKIKL